MRACSLLVMFALAGPALAAQPSGPPLDPAAVQEVHRMGDYLASLPGFRVQVSASDEKVLPDGQKVQFVDDGTVAIRRPDRLRSDRSTPQGTVSYRYDGKSLNIVGPGPYYATAPAPANIDQTVDMARDQYGIDAPAADLVLSRPADALLEDVVSGQDLGQEIIDGVPCEHLAFRGHATDWQIWIQSGDKPLPRRFVITTKDVKSNPEFAVNLSNWDLQSKLGDDTFRYQPAAGAQRVKILTQSNRPGAVGRRPQ